MTERIELTDRETEKVAGGAFDGGYTAADFDYAARNLVIANREKPRSGISTTLGEYKIVITSFRGDELSMSYAFDVFNAGGAKVYSGGESDFIC